MIDMAPWVELVVDVVDDLHLDPRNVRLELPVTAAEPDIMADLFTNEKAFDLAQNIVRAGFFTHEMPVVVRRDRLLVVVEGNRRVAALKAIQNPYLAPGYQARLAKLAQELDPEQRARLRTIRVKCAPNEDDANQLVAALHTGHQRVAWTPNRQSAFFQALIDAGKTAEQLIAEYPTIDVRKFIVRSGILNLFRNVTYKNLTLKDYVSRRNFPISTLARLYENPDFLAIVQINIEASKARVTLKGPKRRFALLAEKIIGDIATKYIDTQKLNSTKSDFYRSYLNELRDLVDTSERSETADDESVSDPTGSTSGTSPRTKTGRPSSQTGSTTTAKPAQASGEGTTTSSAKDPEGEAEKTGEAKKPSTPRKAYLSMSGLEVPSGFPYAIHMTFKELSEVNIQRFPNATLDLIRTFLEKCIKAYAESINEEIKKTSNDGKGFVYLSQCLDWLEEHVKTTKRTAFIQVINKVKSGRLGGYVPSMDHLNAVNHNHHIFATADEVRDCWNTIHGLLKVILKP
ncbi:hypothetical protein ACFLIM_20875 [Nonomuraea sp. M3C6]|uniref:ParB/Sulfiredoxin domain-containing protein n=1 Tax=Nonomuraea marmarensis TaxID=3351344 RepID=A0ABW7AE81_9ACTN